MNFKESYQSHKNKCIKNASRIEAAINQLTNLKKAVNLVMTGVTPNKEDFVVNKIGEFRLPAGTLNRNLHGNAHVCRYDSNDHREYYYISFSSKKYRGGEDFENEDTYWILSISQLKNTNLTYILVTDDGLYTADPKQFKRNRRTASLPKKDWIPLNNVEEKTYMDFTYLQMTDPTKKDRVTGRFAVTFILPSGNELYYSGTSKRDLYKRIFESEEFRQIDAISYNTFGYHFTKGTDWVIENGDKKIVAKFSQDVAEKKTKCTKKVKSLGEIEQELEGFEKEDNCFFETETRLFDKSVIELYLKSLPEDLRTVRSLRNFLNNPALWND